MAINFVVYKSSEKAMNFFKVSSIEYLMALIMIQDFSMESSVLGYTTNPNLMFIYPGPLFFMGNSIARFNAAFPSRHSTLFFRTPKTRTAVQRFSSRLLFDGFSRRNARNEEIIRMSLTSMRLTCGADGSSKV